MRDLLPSVDQIGEPVLIQALVAEAPVETLHVAVPSVRAADTQP